MRDDDPQHRSGSYPGPLPAPYSARWPRGGLGGNAHRGLAATLAAQRLRGGGRRGGLSATSMESLPMLAFAGPAPPSPAWRR